MKKVVSLLIAVLMMVISSLGVFSLSYGEEWEIYEASVPTTFEDVDYEHWAYDAIMNVYKKNWFKGYPDGTFRPNTSITRAEALKVFVVFLGLDYESIDLSDMTYYDVDRDDWYAPYIEAGKDLFPVHTTIQGKTPFNPEMPVTREDTVYALVKALRCDADVKYPDQSVLNMFSDKLSISGNLRNTFSIALEHELVSGFPDSTIRAQDALTRAEFATLLLRGTKHGIHKDYDAVISTVTVTPSDSVTLEIGESISLSARATYTDHSNFAYTELSPYIESGNGIISLYGTEIKAVKEGTAVIKYNDSYLKKEKLTVTVEKPDDTPTIKITGYDAITEETTAKITGTIRDKSSYVDLTCNNDDVLIIDTTFEHTVHLSVGKNTFEFVAKNEYGNTSSKSISITRKEPEPTTVKMVNIVGKKEADAREILKELGVSVKTETIWDDNIASGTVLKQSIDAGEEIEIGSTVKITVSGGKNDWVGWTDNLPPYISSTDYEIEEKTQYRYMELETTSSASPSKSGWTLDKQSESWSEWSGWSENKVNSSSTREVRTKDVANPAQYKTQWNYTRYYGWNPNKNCYVSWPWKGTYSTKYQERGWSDSPLENRGKGDGVDATVYKDSGDSISVWWWNESTRNVELPTTYHTEYQYRDKTTTYYFSKWTDWSEWSDNSISENETTKVETKKVYRYKFK